MASQGDPTRSGAQAAPPPPPPREGVDLTTLILSAIASAASAYITSKIWAPGTLFSAAMSPVIVALVKEALRKPTEVVTSVVPAAVTRGGRSRAGDTVAQPPVAHEPLPGDLPDRLAAGAPPPYPPPAPGAGTGPVRVYSTRSRRLRWRLAIVTGLLGFAICVVLFTVPELLAGKPVSGGSGTTLFSTSHHKSKRSSTTTLTKTTTAPGTTTPTQTTETTTVTRTQTIPAPQATTTTTPPSTSVPAPSTATPAPSTGGTSSSTTP
jgi:hypothetical protein